MRCEGCCDERSAHAHTPAPPPQLAAAAAAIAVAPGPPPPLPPPPLTAATASSTTTTTTTTSTTTTTAAAAATTITTTTAAAGWARGQPKRQKTSPCSTPLFTPTDNLEPTEKRYFGLPSNAEQESVVATLEKQGCAVLVGPPGTGKSQTIANVICHYLALGRRVLVTSKGEPATEVRRFGHFTVAAR